MTTTADPASFALSARIFHAAMQRQVSLDAYAATLGIPGDTLRAVLSGQTGQLPPEVASQLAATHGQRGDAALAPSTAVADTEPFSAWLERQMEGVPQASLRGRAQLEARVLRAFLSGKVLPDADQAERLARSLYVNSGEMARVIVADMSRRAGAPAGQSGSATGAGAAGANPPATPGSAPPDAPARARRRKPAADATQAPAATIPPDEAAPPPTPTPPAPSEIAQAEAAPLAEGAQLAAPGPKRRRRTAEPAVDPAPAATPASSTPERVAAVAEVLTPQAETLPSAGADPPPTPSPRKGSRAGGAVPSPAAPHAASGGEERPVSVPEGRAPRRNARTRAAAPAAEEAGTAVDGQGDPDEHVGGRPTAPEPPAATGDAPAGTDVTGASTRAPTQPTTEGRRKAAARPASPPTAAAAGSPEGALDLSPDEVRLILGYRRLHPHGRRATLRYIGSLLIEE